MARRSIAVSCAVSFALALAVPARAAPVTIERIVAIVNSEILLLSDVKERAAQLGQAIPEVTTGSMAEKRQAEQAMRQVLDRMVDDVLVVQQANELKLAVEDSEIEKAIDEVRRQNKLDAETFAKALSEQGFTLANYRRDLRKQLLRLKVINTAVRSRINISDEEVKAFYEQSARAAGAHRQVHLRRVLVAIPAGGDERELERRRRIAQRVVDEQHAGGDFAELAKRYSEDDATRDKGGDLGWLQQGEVKEDPMTDVAFTLETPGDVRGPIRTARGFEVIQLVERKDGDLRPFAEAREQIHQQLYSAQLEKQTSQWLAELRKKAHIDVRL